MAIVRDYLRRLDWGYGLVLLGLWALVSLGLVQQLELPWPLGLAISTAVCAFQGLMCRSARYVAKVTPLRHGASWPSALATLVGASIFSGLLFVGASLLLLVMALRETAALETIVPTITPWLMATGTGSYLLSAAYFSAGFARREAIVARQAVSRAELLAKDAELAALSAKLSPHFLFNSLSSIAALVSLDPPRARAMVLELAEFMRSRLHAGEAALVPLSEELRIARQYLALEKMRFADRVTIEEHVDPRSLLALVPALLLQPLLENALKHGIALLEEGGVIVLRVSVRGAHLSLDLENPVERVRAARQTRSGLGLVLVRQRLEAHYRDQASLKVEVVDKRFIVRVQIPFLTNEDNP